MFVFAYVYSITSLFIRKLHHNHFLAYPATVDVGGAIGVAIGAAIGGAVVGAVGGVVVGAVGAISVTVCIVSYRKKKKV